MSANRTFPWRSLLLAALAILAGLPALSLAVENLGAHRVRGMEEFEQVIDLRCTVCHTRERIEQAIAEKRDRTTIQREMEARGAILTERDKEVLGTFWGKPQRGDGTPLAPGAYVEEEGWLEFQRIIEARCLLCHTRERIDQAVEKHLPFEPIEELMLKRGAQLTPAERKVLRTFWGGPGSSR